MGLAARILVAAVLCVLASIAIALFPGAPMRNNFHTNPRHPEAQKGRNPFGGRRRGPVDNYDARNRHREPPAYRPSGHGAIATDQDEDEIPQMPGGNPYREGPHDYNGGSSNDDDDDTEGFGGGEGHDMTPETGEVGEAVGGSASPAMPDSRTDSTTKSIGEAEDETPTFTSTSSTSTSTTSTTSTTSSTTSTTSITSADTVASSDDPTHNDGDVQYGLIAVIALLFLGIIAINVVSIVVYCQTKGRCVGKKEKSIGSKNPREPAGGNSADPASSAVEYDQSIGAEEAAAIYTQKYGEHSSSA